MSNNAGRGGLIDTSEPGRIDTSWMESWEFWAWRRIREGRPADFELIPEEAKGGKDLDKAFQARPFSVVETEEGRTTLQPVPLEAWPAWQRLTSRFVATILQDPLFTAQLSRPSISIFHVIIYDPAQQGSADPEKPKVALDLNYGRIPAGLSLVYVGFDGGINGYSLQLDGAFQMRACYVPEEVRIDGISTGGNLVMNSTILPKGVRFVGSKIGGDLDMQTSVLGSGTTGEEDVLSFDRTTVGGNCFFNDINVWGLIRFPAAKIDYNVYFSDTRLAAKVKGLRVLDMEGATIGDCLSFKEAELLSIIDLRGVTVTRSLYLNGATIDAPIDLSEAEIGQLIMDGGSDLEDGGSPVWGDAASLDFQNTSVDALQSRVSSWRRRKAGDAPEKPRRGDFVPRLLQGFTFKRPNAGTGGKSFKDARSRELKAWLKPRKDSPFSPSVYTSMATALERAGEEGKARDVRVALEQTRTRMESNPFSKLFRRFVLSPVSDYGYNPLKIVVPLLVLILLFALLGYCWELAWLSGREAMAAALEDPAIAGAAAGEGAAAARAAEAVRPANSFLDAFNVLASGAWLGALDWESARAWLGYSLETIVPLVDLDPARDSFLANRFEVGEGLFDEPRFEELPGGLRAMFMFERVLGLLMLSALVAGISGWAERRGR